MPVTLRWVNPAASDLARVVVVLNAEARAAQQGRRHDRLQRAAPVGGLQAARRERARISRSSPSTAAATSPRPRAGDVSLASLIPLRPLTGSVVDSAPRLTWKAKDGTAYYNVQVFRNGRRLLVRWPSHASFRMPENLMVPGHLHLVRVAGDPAQGLGRDVRRPDRPRDVRLQGVSGAQGRRATRFRQRAAVASIHADCGRSSVGRASASQAEGREFEPRRPLPSNPSTSWRSRWRSTAPHSRSQRSSFSGGSNPTYQPRSEQTRFGS